jgi:hypothetical protein
MAIRVLFFHFIGGENAEAPRRIDGVHSHSTDLGRETNKPFPTHHNKALVYSTEGRALQDSTAIAGMDLNTLVNILFREPLSQDTAIALLRHTGFTFDGVLLFI